MAVVPLIDFGKQGTACSRSRQSLGNHRRVRGKLLSGSHIYPDQQDECQPKPVYVSKHLNTTAGDRARILRQKKNLCKFADDCI